MKKWKVCILCNVVILHIVIVVVVVVAIIDTVTVTALLKVETLNETQSLPTITIRQYVIHCLASK